MNLANVFLIPLLLNTLLVTALEGSLTLQLSFGIHLEDFSDWVAFPRVWSSCWMGSYLVTPLWGRFHPLFQVWKQLGAGSSERLLNKALTPNYHQAKLNKREMFMLSVITEHNTHRAAWADPSGRCRGSKEETYKVFSSLL